MAKIIYGVAGEGFGHSSRSHVIGRHLIDAGHEVLFAASRKSLSYLRKHFGEKVKEIAGLSLVYRDGNLLPVRGQYEQVINARYAERLGLALNRTSLNSETLREYLDILDAPMADHADILWPDNRTFFDTLNQTLDRVFSQSRTAPGTIPASRGLLPG
jgi:UDP:flavonoid glycosyltransferase YjiC (YdhE family)